MALVEFFNNKKQPPFLEAKFSVSKKTAAPGRQARQENLIFDTLRAFIAVGSCLLT